MAFDSALELTVGERRSIVDAITEAVFTEEFGRECRLEWLQVVEEFASRDMTLQYLQLAVPYLQLMDPMQRVLVAESIRDHRIEGASVELFAALVADGARVDQAFASLPGSPTASGSLVRVLQGSGELPRGALKRIMREDLKAPQREIAIRMIAGRSMHKIEDVLGLAQRLSVKQAQAAMTANADVGTTFTNYIRGLASAPPVPVDELVASVAAMSRGHAQLLRMTQVRQAIPKWKRVIAERLALVPEVPSELVGACHDRGFALERVVVLAAVLADNPEISVSAVLDVVAGLDPKAAPNIAAALVMEQLDRLAFEAVEALNAEALDRRATQAFVLMSSELEESRLAGLLEAVARISSEPAWQYALDVMVRNPDIRLRLATELTARRDERAPWSMRDLQEFCDSQMRAVRQREQAFSRS